MDKFFHAIYIIAEVKEVKEAEGIEVYIKPRRTAEESYRDFIRYGFSEDIQPLPPTFFEEVNEVIFNPAWNIDKNFEALTHIIEERSDRFPTEMKSKPSHILAKKLFDAINYAKKKEADVLIIDTAGRLHNKKNLMDELAKIYRVIDRELPGVSRENLLVLDATTGQNAVSQAKEFKGSADITGLILHVPGKRKALNMREQTISHGLHKPFCSLAVKIGIHVTANSTSECDQSDKNSDQPEISLQILDSADLIYHLGHKTRNIQFCRSDDTVYCGTDDLRCQHIKGIDQQGGNDADDKVSLASLQKIPYQGKFCVCSWILRFYVMILHVYDLLFLHFYCSFSIPYFQLVV